MMHTLNATMRRRTGFTLIELLAVVAIIALLATLAVAKFGDSKRRAYLAAMKSDLRSVAIIAETRYTLDSSYERMTAPTGSTGITLTFVGTINTWTATAQHERLPGVTCTMTYAPNQSSAIDCQQP